jgi:hypothetical protein
MWIVKIALKDPYTFAVLALLLMIGAAWPPTPLVSLKPALSRKKEPSMSLWRTSSMTWRGAKAGWDLLVQQKNRRSLSGP